LEEEAIACFIQHRFQVTFPEKGGKPERHSISLRRV
jgi:hypothetical protein